MVCRCGSKTTTRHESSSIIIYTTTRHSKLGGRRRRVHEIHVLVKKIFPCLHGIFSRRWLIKILYRKTR